MKNIPEKIKTSDKADMTELLTAYLNKINEIIEFLTPQEEKTTPVTENGEEEWEEEFEQNRPKTDEKILNCRSVDCESKVYKFGYKYKKDSEIHEVTDWGNIKKFISSLISKTKEEERARVRAAIEERHGFGYGKSRMIYIADLIEILNLDN